MIFLCIVCYYCFHEFCKPPPDYRVKSTSQSPRGLFIVSALSDDKAEDVNTDSGLMLERQRGGRETERERERERGTELERRTERDRGRGSEREGGGENKGGIERVREREGKKEGKEKRVRDIRGLGRSVTGYKQISL